MEIRRTHWFGFVAGDRISSGGHLGTVIDPGYDPDDSVFEKRCVPVKMDGDPHTIHWYMSIYLIKVNR